MLHFFGKKDPGGPEERLAACQAKRDWKGLARAFYDLGTAAMEAGDLYRAVLWLHRADTIYSARDDIYEAVGDALIDDCSDRIGALEEEEDLLYNRLPSQVEAAAEKLGDAQIRVWCLLSMARLTRLGERLGTLPGCEVLGRIGRCVDLLLKSFRGPLAMEEFRELSLTADRLSALGDDPALWTGGEVEVPGGEPFQAFDLNGMLLFLELGGFINGQLQVLMGHEEPAECGLVGVTLLLDYHVRTSAGDPSEAPRVRAELARIWEDLDFVRTGLTWAQVAERVEAYKILDILA